MRNCLVIDLDRCSGCDSCTVACKLEHGIDLGVYWNRVKAMGPYGTHPDIEQYWLPTQCQQCENAPCIDVCPTGASYRNEENGVVLVDPEGCIGCGACLDACPYEARTLNPATNIVEKCTLCQELTAEGKQPACVHNCCCGARYYGDLDDPESDAAKAVAAADPAALHQLPDPAGAKPSTIYILSEKTCAWHDPE